MAKNIKEEVIDLGNGVELIMVLIPAGKFLMGSPDDEANREDDEMQHKVTISKPFYMGKFEVTQEQWELLMGNNPSPSEFKGKKVPVTDITWDECQNFIKNLNKKTKSKFRLPTEAEWEYSCRAGTSTAYSFGDLINPSNANYRDPEKDEDSEPLPVGRYNKSNAFGLCDMHGNVLEWCNDWWDWYENYSDDDFIDPQGPSEGDYRIFRGGSCFENPSELRSAYRGSGVPSDRHGALGFRLAMTITTK